MADPDNKVWLHFYDKNIKYSVPKNNIKVDIDSATSWLKNPLFQKQNYFTNNVNDDDKKK